MLGSHERSGRVVLRAVFATQHPVACFLVEGEGRGCFADEGVLERWLHAVGVSEHLRLALRAAQLLDRALGLLELTELRGQMLRLPALFERLRVLRRSLY